MIVDFWLLYTHEAIENTVHLVLNISQKVQMFLHTLIPCKTLLIEPQTSVQGTPPTSINPTSIPSAPLKPCHRSFSHHLTPGTASPAIPCLGLLTRAGFPAAQPCWPSQQGCHRHGVPTHWLSPPLRVEHKRMGPEPKHLAASPSLAVLSRWSRLFPSSSMT